ncbi:MAG: maltose ABC transporter substrate-binding protein [Chloroflexi bacterium]|nr:maltose ABC transporter substrate-binding protein [Chloroflexota bacterium]
MNKNKWYTLIVLLLMGVLFLAACGGAADEPAADEPVAEEEVTEEEAMEEEEMEEEAVEEEAAEEEAMEEEEMEEEAVEEEAAEEEAMEEEEMEEEEMEEEDALTLTIWSDDTRTPAIESVAGDFEAEFGVAVVIEEVGFGDIRDLFTTAGPAGEGPDIIVGAHDWLGELVSNGLLAPLDLGDKAGDFAAAAVQAFTYDGELYGMPNATENVAFFINQDIVPECPATWTEVLDISRELAADNDDDIDTNKYGFVRMEGDPFHFFPIQTAFGGYVFGVTDAGYDATDVGIDSEGAIAAAQYYETFVAEGLQPPAIDWETMHLWFETGQSAMTITGPWAMGRIRDAGVNYAICNNPSEVESGKPFLGAQGFMVSAFSEDPLLAQIFLSEFVATADVMQAFYDTDPRPPAYLPVLNSLEDADLLAFGEAGSEALPMPAIPEMSAVWEAWGNAVVLIAQGGDTADSAFTNAAEQIRTAIAEGG